MKITTCTIALLLAALPASAQNPKDPPQQRGRSSGPAVSTSIHPGTAGPQNNNGHAVRVIGVPPITVRQGLPGWLTIVLSFALVLVGVGGIAVAVRTLRKIGDQASETARAARATEEAAFATARSVEEIQRQTGVLERSVAVAEKAAKAAETSAEAQLNSERAWVLEKINFPNDLPVQGQGSMIVAYVGFTFRNEGRTPARITAVRLRFHTVKYPGHLPDPPDYGLGRLPEIGAYGMMLAPGKEIAIGRPIEDHPSFEETDKNEIRNGTLGVYAYGIVEYVTLDSKRFNRFCYQWHEPGWGFTTSADVAGFRKGGPPEYNNAT